MDKTIIAIKAPHEGAFYGEVDEITGVSLSSDMLAVFKYMKIDAAQDPENTLVLATSNRNSLIFPKLLEWDKAGLQPNDIPSVILDGYGGAKEQILKNIDGIPEQIKILNVAAADILGTGLDFTITFYEDRKDGKSRTYAAVHAGEKTLVGFVVSKTISNVLIGAISAALSTKNIPNTKLGVVTKVLISGGGAIAGAMAANSADSTLQNIAAAFTRYAEEMGGETPITMDIIDPQNRIEKGFINIIPKGNGQVQTQTINGVVDVQSHIRDGHEVRAHQRTRPDGDTSNNLSER